MRYTNVSVSGKNNESLKKVGLTAFRNMPVRMNGIAGLSVFRIESRISNQFGYRRKFGNIAANFRKNTGGKSFTNAGNDMKFAVKSIINFSNFQIENIDTRFKGFKLFNVLFDNERKTGGGENNAERISRTLLNLASFVETESATTGFLKKVG